MRRFGAGMNSNNYRALLHFNAISLLRWAKASSLRDGEQLAVGTTHCSAARLSRLLRRQEREQTKAASRREPQRSRQTSNLTLTRAPPPRPAPSSRGGGQDTCPRQPGAGGRRRTPKLAAAAKVAPGRRWAGRHYSPAPGC